MSEMGRQQRQSQREAGRGCAAGFEPGEGASTQGVQVASRSWKRRKQISPQSLQEKYGPFTP